MFELRKKNIKMFMLALMNCWKPPMCCKRWGFLPCYLMNVKDLR